MVALALSTVLAFGFGYFYGRHRLLSTPPGADTHSGKGDRPDTLRAQLRLTANELRTERALIATMRDNHSQQLAIIRKDAEWFLDKFAGQGPRNDILVRAKLLKAHATPRKELR